MFRDDRRTLSRLKSRKVSKDKRGRLRDYAISAGRGALLGATADLMNPLSTSGRHSLLFPLMGAGALAGAGYEAYKGMKKKAALENFYRVKEASKASWYDLKGRYKEERAKAIKAKPPTPKDFSFYLGSMYHDRGRKPNFKLPTGVTQGNING